MARSRGRRPAARGALAAKLIEALNRAAEVLFENHAGRGRGRDLGAELEQHSRSSPKYPKQWEQVPWPRPKKARR